MRTVNFDAIQANAGTIPTYSDMPPGASAFQRVGYTLALRMTGPFIIHTESDVILIDDGWLCERSNGELFGVEASEFNAQFTNLYLVTTPTDPPNGRISVTAPSGNVTSMGTPDDSVVSIFEAGATAHAEMIPDANYAVADVLVDGVSVGAVPEYDFEAGAALTVDHTISATFVHT